MTGPAALLASESVSSGIWWWRLGVVVLAALAVLSGVGFVVMLRRTKAPAADEGAPQP